MFLEEAAKVGMHEIQMGRLGIERGQSQAIKGFCQRLINDHSLANKEMAALPKQKGLMLPGDDAKSIVSPITPGNSANFDKEFARAMVEVH